MDQINNIVNMLNNYMYSYVLIVLLLGIGLFYSIKTRFIQFDWRNIKLAFKESLQDSDKTNKKISPFEAFAVTTASRVGTGNLAGIALAITLGGPGAVFWMWITALLGGALAFVESTLAQVYKTEDKNPVSNAAHFIGGPSYYMQKGLGSKALGSLFSVILIFVFGFSFNAVQANTISQALQNSFNIPSVYSAIMLSILTAVFIFKGLPKIARSSAIIVPIMALLYLVLCAIVIFNNFSRIPEVFSMIFENAFGFREFGTGTLIGTITTGIKRGLFSNEAGMGSAPNAAASASTSHPVKQGLIQACGVFFDTIIICSATAFLILFSGVDFSNPDQSGIILTQTALNSFFGDFGNIFLAICIFLLAFSSVLGNYFYAQNSMSFLSSKKNYMFIFQVAVVASVFLGSMSTLSLVWNMADLLMGMMTILNLYAILKLYKVLTAVLKDYKTQRANNTNPIFKSNEFECWK
ncbi:MAG: alanine/glycine:cation symporter family protein [Brevinema sp.]